jgi:hypothetical protein
MALPLGRVGRQEIVERCRPFGTLDLGDRLRIAARKHVAIKLWPLHQLARRRADRLEAFEPERKCGRHFGRARSIRFRALRQQQAGLEEGEPSGHHQIVGGELEPQLAGGFDESEILIGKREDRDAGEIDLLLAGKRQQQVQRPLESVDIDDQRRLIRGPLDCFVQKLVRIAGHIRVTQRLPSSPSYGKR